jgi:hypothetical protein
MFRLFDHLQVHIRVINKAIMGPSTQQFFFSSNTYVYLKMVEWLKDVAQLNT